MATTDILPFATGGGANVETQAAYAADPTTGTGFISGTASSLKLNKVWRQSAFMAAVLANWEVSQNISVPDDGVLATAVTNLNLALQGIPKERVAIAAGTVDVITGDFTPDVTTTLLINGYTVFVKALGANATTTPTFQADATTARTIVKGNNLALLAGDIAGSGYWMQLQYDSTLTKWVLLNPANGVIPPVIPQAILPGTIIDYSGTSAPTGYLLCPITPTNVSRTTYAALFAAIGTTWGVGDGSTTFGIPYFLADQVSLQANSNVGTQTVGVVLAHTHGIPNNAGSGSTYAYGLTSGASATVPSVQQTPAGGTYNLAAGTRVLKCVKY